MEKETIMSVETMSDDTEYRIVLVEEEGVMQPHRVRIEQKCEWGDDANQWVGIEMDSKYAPVVISKLMELFAPKSDVNLTVYVVRNNDGHYFRAKGYGGGGKSWVEDINNARIYAKIGPARATVTWFANHHPKFPPAQLLKLTVGKVEVVDETERVQKAVKKKKLENANRIASHKKWELEQAQIQLKDAEATIKRLKGK